MDNQKQEMLEHNKNEPTNPRYLAIYACFITFILSVFEQILLYFTTFIFANCGYYHIGTYKVVLQMVGSAISLLFVFRIIIKLGYQSSMVLGNSMIFLNVASYYLPIWLPFEEQGTSLHSLICAFSLIGGFIGGVGFNLKREAFFQYLTDCQGFIEETTYTDTIRSRMFSVVSMVGFPIAAALIKVNMETLISANLYAILICSVLDLSLPRVGKEEKPDTFIEEYQSVFKEQLFSSQFLKLIPLIILSGFINSLTIGLMVLYTRNKAGHSGFYILTLFGVGELLRFMFNDFRKYFNARNYKSGLLMVLILMVLAMILIDVSTNNVAIIYFQIPLLGILLEVVNSFLCAQYEMTLENPDDQFYGHINFAGSLSTAISMIFLMTALYNDSFLVYFNIMHAFGILTILLFCQPLNCIN